MPSKTHRSSSYQSSPTPTESSKPRTKLSKLAKISITLVAIFLVVITATTLGIWQLIKPFLSETGLTIHDVKNKIMTARALKPQFANKSINFLLLGLDRRNDSLEKTILTDSIVIASLNTGTSQVKLVPLPRDLWIDKYKSKINSLYYFGEIYQNGGLPFATQAISEISGQRIDYTFIIDYFQLKELVDILGGVDVVVDKAFTDEEYPNPNLPNNPQEPPFITISFETGPTHLSGEQALQFVRSRHSTDPEVGSDTSRNARQMTLFNSLIDKTASKQTALDPVKVGKLYKFWKEQIQTTILEEELLSIAMTLDTTKAITVSSKAIPSITETTGAILVHPPISRKYLSAWVFIPRDPTLKEFQDFIAQALL